MLKPSTSSSPLKLMLLSTSSLSRIPSCFLGKEEEERGEKEASSVRWCHSFCFSPSTRLFKKIERKMKNSFEVNESGRRIRWTSKSGGADFSGGQSSCPAKSPVLFDLSEAIGSYDPDELLLLPSEVLEMDSLSFCKDVASVAPCFMSTSFGFRECGGFAAESNRLLQDNPSGLIFTKASNGCLWLCKFAPVTSLRKMSALPSKGQRCWFESLPEKGLLLRLTFRGHHSSTREFFPSGQKFCFFPFWLFVGNPSIAKSSPIASAPTTILSGKYFEFLARFWISTRAAL